MLAATDVANYFLCKDTTQCVFNKKLVNRNGRDFYEGNARLNKYLHIAQNIYIAKSGQKLFEDPLYAYDNGAVAIKVQENYSILLSRKHKPNIPQDKAEFLDQIYKVLENASLDELIQISREDTEWQYKHDHYTQERQKMDSMARVDEYREQYADILRVMARLPRS